LLYLILFAAQLNSLLPPEVTPVADPQGGYFIWMQLPPGLDATELQTEAIKVRACTRDSL